MNQKQQLDDLTDDLSHLIGNEDLTDEDLREASESLLPALCDALHEMGYGNRLYKIWSNEHNAWWKPNSKGYTQERKLAGAYKEHEALDIVERANIGLKDVPNEAMVEIVADEPFGILPEYQS